MATRSMREATARTTVLPPLAEQNIADEANHRIANSLQLLVTLVSIESSLIADPTSLAVLDAIKRRIRAIGAVHRLLYRIGRGAIDLATYLEQLGYELEAACADPQRGRHVFVDAASILVPAEHAVALGVLVAELVANACKYAYPQGQEGSIWIALRSQPGGYCLEVSDRGSGLSGNLAGSGFGTLLVGAMVQRLGGTCRCRETRQGTHFVLSVDGN